jgi:hypothetical protein
VSAELERSYRRALGWYPRSWREKNADVVAGTLLDVADAEHRTRPRRGELANLAASGISTRLGVMLEPRARNAISTIALATGFAYPLAHFAYQLWSRSASTANDNIVWTAYASQGFNGLVNPGLVITAAWTLALVLALMPRQRGLRSVLALATFASVALILINQIPGIGHEWYGLTTTTMVFLALLGALALIGTPARGLQLLLYTGVTFLAAAGAYGLTAFFVRSYFDERFFLSNISGTLSLLLVFAALTAIAFGVAHRTATAQTIAISAIPWSLLVLRFFSTQDLWNTLGLLGIAVALVGFGALLPLAFRHVRPNVPSKTGQDMTPLP